MRGLYLATAMIGAAFAANAQESDPLRQSPMQLAPAKTRLLKPKVLTDNSDSVASIPSKPEPSRLTSVPAPAFAQVPTPAIGAPLNFAPLPLPRPSELAALPPAQPLNAPQQTPADASVPTIVQPLRGGPAIPLMSAQNSALLKHKLAAKGFTLGQPVFVRIFKQESKLEVWMKKSERYELFEVYNICKWSGGLGPKQVFGDYQSPEGFYMVSRAQLNPESTYHLAFNVGYPNAYDKSYGRTGSALMVHGDCKSVGCFAMTDNGIEFVYALVAAALEKQAEVPVHIFPFRMSGALGFKTLFSPWRSFWANLKEGYDLFEQSKMPPLVSVCNRTYMFGQQGDGCTRIAGW